MNCRQAKMDIALCVGEDLTDADRREKLRQHLTGCPECRSHFKRLKGMFQVLEQADGQPTYDSVDSLWPGLVGRLGKPQPRMMGPRFNGWVPFSVMAAACVLLMIVMEMQPDRNAPIAGNSFPRGFLGISFGQDLDSEPGDDDGLNSRVESTEAAMFGPPPERLVEPLIEPSPDPEPSF